jgi:SPP1 family phage portal protein
VSYGRLKISTDTSVITAENVVDEVSKAYATHCVNQADIQKLWDTYRGKTRIINKEKEVRREINHKINENRAYEIVSFHKGYVFGEPIQYVRRENATAKENDDILAADINALNGYMSDANKAACDNSLAEWIYVAGNGYRMTLPTEKWKADGDEPPFEMYSLDPRRAFVVYSTDIDEHPVMAVYCSEREDGKVFSVYTDNMFFKFKEHSGEVQQKANTLGMIPIIEYPADNAHLGVFEIAVPLLDAIDELQSNRMDDIVQFVNSFLGIFGGELDEETYKRLNDWKTLCLPEGTDAKYLSASLSQADVQTLKEDLVQACFEICGVPNRNGGTSTSDTGSAVVLRDGWQAAEARAKATEEIFKSAEKRSLKIVLRILRDRTGTKLRLSDIVPHFTRRNYDNIASKSQVLLAMLNSPWVHPEVAYASCGMFPDPESAYLQGKAWNEERQKKAMEVANAVQDNDEETTPDETEGGEE